MVAASGRACVDSTPPPYQSLLSSDGATSESSISDGSKTHMSRWTGVFLALTPASSAKTVTRATTRTRRAMIVRQWLWPCSGRSEMCRPLAFLSRLCDRYRALIDDRVDPVLDPAASSLHAGASCTGHGRGEGDRHLGAETAIPSHVGIPRP